MRGEFGLLRSQLKGYLFEVVIMELLIRSGFHPLDVRLEPPNRVREMRDGFIEIKGRGCWHQIDCPCDYSRPIPFSYPLRLLGEVKFYKTPLEKKHIRAYIGVIKDIQENYFVTDGMAPEDIYPRQLEFGVYFSASGFQAEAEKLAYAHGIKTVSYRNHCLMEPLKELVAQLEEECLSVRCLSDGAWKSVRQELVDMLRNGVPAWDNSRRSYWSEDCLPVLDEIRWMLSNIRTSFIATTANGVFLHFIGKDKFPAELFRDTDRQYCRVYYNTAYRGERYFWLEINGDRNRSRFYFTPPEALEEASLYGKELVLNEKERTFRFLNVNIIIEGIARSLTLQLDQDWLQAARNREYR